MTRTTTRGRPPGPNEALGSERRESVKIAAKHLFARQGYMATTVRQIAHAVSMEGGSLYYHFGDKEEILLAILDEGNYRLLDAARAVLERTAGDPTETLRCLIGEHVRILAKDPPLFKVTLELHWLKGERRRRIVEQRAEYEHLIQDVIAAGIRKKQFRRCDVKVVSFGLISYLNGVAFWFNPKGALSIEQIATEYCNNLLQGLEV